MTFPQKIIYLGIRPSKRRVFSSCVIPSSSNFMCEKKYLLTNTSSSYFFLMVMRDIRKKNFYYFSLFIFLWKICFSPPCVYPVFFRLDNKTHKAPFIVRVFCCYSGNFFPFFVRISSESLFLLIHSHKLFFIILLYIFLPSIHTFFACNINML